MTGLAPLAFMAVASRCRPARVRADARLGARFLAGGQRDARDMLANHWYAADALAEQLGLDDRRARDAVPDLRALGRQGSAQRGQGEEILLASRIVHLADVSRSSTASVAPEARVAVAQRSNGYAVRPGPRRRRGRHDAGALFDGLDEVTTWDAVIAAEPGLARVLSDDELDSALEAIADFIDIKSPFTLGHSRGVADLAAGAAEGCGLPAPTSPHVRRAALVHDIGRLGVSNAVWDKPGELSAGETERVRLHPYLTDRMLAGLARRSPRWARPPRSTTSGSTARDIRAVCAARR